MFDNLKANLLSLLTKKYGKETYFNNDSIEVDIEIAIKKIVEVSLVRENTKMTDAEIEKYVDSNYFSFIFDLVARRFSMDGADFQKSHSENGISRSWIDEDEIIKYVTPFVKVF